MISKSKILEHLEVIASIIPVNVYWLDTDNIFLGANNSTIESIGGTSLDDLIGKTLYDFYPQEIADKIVQNHNEVIRTGKTLKHEETIKDITTGESKYFTAVKAPLRDELGKIIGTISASIDMSAEKQESAQLKKIKLFEHLEKVAQNFPTPFYWLGLNQEYLGVNKHGLMVTGTRSYKEDFAGKTPYSVYPKEMAEDIVRHHEEVIQSKEILSAEESIKDVATGQIKYFNAFIAPLFDDENKVIGTIGTSIETTAEKEAASLKLENEIQKVKIEEQEQFKRAARKVIHDIASPLAALNMTLSRFKKDIPEEARITLRTAATDIGDIAGGLLYKYKKEKRDWNDYQEGYQSIPVFLILRQLLTEKKYQYDHLLVNFKDDFSEDSYFASIYTDPLAFKRMISNVINNAVDSLEKKEGEVKIKLEADENQVRVIIQDNGKGMPPDIVNKIMQNIAVTNGKEHGHGIGYTQICDTLQQNKGKLEIDSVAERGTTITLSFPRVNPPDWIAKEITLNEDDTVIILDDEASIHSAWKSRFSFYAQEIKMKHFTFAEEAIEFINASPDKNKLFLLTDFELLEQKLNGLHVVERTCVPRAILVTSHHASKTVRALAEKVGVKILPKQMAPEVIIEVMP